MDLNLQFAIPLASFITTSIRSPCTQRVNRPAFPLLALNRPVAKLVHVSIVAVTPLRSALMHAKVFSAIPFDHPLFFINTNHTGIDKDTPLFSLPLDRNS